MANKDNTYSPSSSSSTLNLHRRPRRTQHSAPQTQSNPPSIAHKDLQPHPKIAHKDLQQRPSIAHKDISTAHQDLPQQPKNLKLILKLPHKPRSGIAADSSRDSSSSQCTPSTVLAPLPSSPISGSIEKLPKLVILGRDSAARRGDRSNPSGPKLDSAQNGGPKVIPGAPIAPIATIRGVEKGLRSSRLEKQDGLATHSESAVPEEENGDAMPPRKRKLRSLAGGDRVVGNTPNGGQKEEISSPAKKLTEKNSTIVENTEDALKLSIVTPLPPKSVLDGILERLQKKDTYGVFAEPVDGKEVRGYYDIIKNPMDFGTMKTKLSKGAYRSLESFEGDVFLVCSNAMHFNGPKTIYFKQAKAIQAVAQKEFQSLRSVLGMTEGRLGRVGAYYKSGPVVAASREVAVMDGTYGSYAHCLEIVSNIVDENKERSSFLAENNGKFGLSRDGRRPLSTEENRRNTYQPFEDDSDYSMNSISLMAVGNQPASSYVHSLSQFGANFGPSIRSHVEKKIQRVLAIQRWQGLQTQGVAEDFGTSVTDHLQTRPPLPGHAAPLPKGGADAAMGPRSNAFPNAFSDAHTAGPPMGVMHFPMRTGNMAGGPLQNMHGGIPANPAWTGQPSSRNLSAINLNSVPAPQVAGFIEVNPSSSGITPLKNTEKSVAAVHDVLLHRMGSNASQLSAEGSDGPQREVSPMPYMFQNATRDVQGPSTKPVPHEPQFSEGSRSETRNPVMTSKSLAPCSSQTAVDMSRRSRDVDAPTQAFPDSGWKIQSRGPETMFSQDLNIALDVNGTIESPPSARRTPLFVSSSAQAGCTVPFLGNSSMQPGCIKEDGKMVSNEAPADDFVLRERVMKLMGLQQQQQFFQKPDDLSSKVQQVNSQVNYAVQQHPLKAHDFIYPAAFVNCNPPSGSQIWHSSSSSMRSDQQAQSSVSPRPSSSRAQPGSQQPDLALQL